MANPWLAHLKAFWQKNKGKMSYKQAMVAAKSSYKRSAVGDKQKKKGGEKSRGKKA